MRSHVIPNENSLSKVGELNEFNVRRLLRERPADSVACVDISLLIPASCRSSRGDRSSIVCRVTIITGIKLIVLHRKKGFMGYLFFSPDFRGLIRVLMDFLSRKYVPKSRVKGSSNLLYLDSGNGLQLLFSLSHRCRTSRLRESI